MINKNGCGKMENRVIAAIDLFDNRREMITSNVRGFRPDNNPDSEERILPPESAMGYPAEFDNRYTFDRLAGGDSQLIGNLSELLAGASENTEGFGNVNTSKGRILINNNGLGSIIPGVAMASGAYRGMDFTEVNVIPTSNNGFRYVGIDDDDNLMDLGAVHNPVLVGDGKQVSAMLVPFNSENAIKDGYEFLGAMLETSDQACKRCQENMEREREKMMRQREMNMIR